MSLIWTGSRRAYLVRSRANIQEVIVINADKYSLKSDCRKERTRMRSSNSNWRVVFQNCGIFLAWSLHQPGYEEASSTDSKCFLYALCWTIYNAEAVTWCAYLVRVMCAEVTNDAALPSEVIPACATALVHPLPESQDPIALRTANSLWSPPSIITSLSSPIVSVDASTVFP